jgi:hypothetical protein
MSQMPWMKHYDDTNQVISNDDSNKTRVCIISFNVEEGNGVTGVLSLSNNTPLSKY